jgi:hypothetical protein
MMEELVDEYIQRYKRPLVFRDLTEIPLWGVPDFYPDGRPKLYRDGSRKRRRMMLDEERACIRVIVRRLEEQRQQWLAENPLRYKRGTAAPEALPRPNQ